MGQPGLRLVRGVKARHEWSSRHPLYGMLGKKVKHHTPSIRLEKYPIAFLELYEAEQGLILRP
jgi:hypothetical protein